MNAFDFSMVGCSSFQCLAPAKHLCGGGVVLALGVVQEPPVVVPAVPALETLGAIRWRLEAPRSGEGPPARVDSWNSWKFLLFRDS